MSILIRDDQISYFEYSRELSAAYALVASIYLSIYLSAVAAHVISIESLWTTSHNSADSIFVGRNAPHRPKWTGPDRHRTATPTRKSSPCGPTLRDRAERRSVLPPPLGAVLADEVRSRSTSIRLREQCSNHRLQRGRRVPQTQALHPQCVIAAPPRAWQAVVTCMPLSDKAAAAHVEALSAFQRYEPTGAAACAVMRHALGPALCRARILIPSPSHRLQKRCTASSPSRSRRLPCGPRCRPRCTW